MEVEKNNGFEIHGSGTRLFPLPKNWPELQVWCTEFRWTLQISPKMLLHQAFFFFNKSN